MPPASPLPSFDVDHLRSTIGNDADFERMLLDEFLSQSADILSRMAGMLAAGDPAGVRAAAHELKGSSRTIGALALGEQCQILETLAGTGHLAGADEVHDEVLHEFDRVRVAILTHIQKVA